MHALRRSPLLVVLLASAAFSRAQTPTWSNLDHGLGSTINELNSVAFGNGIFVAIKTTMTGGTLHYATSTDGTAWTARTIATSIASSGSAQRVRFLNGRFLIMPIGLSGGAGAALALTSTDGLTWTSSNVSTTTTSPDEMDFGNGRVLGVGSNGYCVGSTDFSTWTAQSTSLQGAFAIQDVAFGNGRWFDTTNGGGGEVATRTDGVNFTKVNGLSVSGGFRVGYGYKSGSLQPAQQRRQLRRRHFHPGDAHAQRHTRRHRQHSFRERPLSRLRPEHLPGVDRRANVDNFGAISSLGSGFIFSAITDFAYWNLTYVAVGSRGFPPTAALIFTSIGPTEVGPQPDPTSFTLAFQVRLTALPGTTAPRRPCSCSAPALGNTWITGGDLEQANGRAVQVSGLTQLKVADGASSHYVTTAPVAAYFFNARTNKAVLQRDGVDVTAQIVVQ